MPVKVPIFADRPAGGAVQATRRGLPSREGHGWHTRREPSGRTTEGGPGLMIGTHYGPKTGPYQISSPTS